MGLDKEWSMQNKSGYKRRIAGSHNGCYRQQKGMSKCTQASNTPCLHTSCKVHWCYQWIFQKRIVLGHLNNKYRYYEYVISFFLVCSSRCVEGTTINYTYVYKESNAAIRFLYNRLNSYQLLREEYQHEENIIHNILHNNGFLLEAKTKTETFTKPEYTTTQPQEMVHIHIYW